MSDRFQTCSKKRHQALLSIQLAVHFIINS